MSWKRELAESVTTPGQLAERFGIDAEPMLAVAARYPMQITPHTLNLMTGLGDPVWCQVVPDPAELFSDNLPDDSLNEKAYSPVPSIVHRYPDRALLMVSGQCAGYCRFCTRKSRIGTSQLCFDWQQIAEGIDYLADTPGICDVILTGGDPLLLDDNMLAEILDRLQRIAHIDIIRIGSRVPVTLPTRITPQLCQMLARFHPLYLNTHFNHPQELTETSAAACGMLADVGIQLGNQTVLLNGINDDFETMLTLYRGLLKMRVRPYYLHQLDQTQGTAHFRVDVAKGLEIVRRLRGRIAGMAIPQYVIDPPDGSGKVLLS